MRVCCWLCLRVSSHRTRRFTGRVEIQHFIFDGAFHASDGSDPRELSVRRIDRTTIEQQTRRNGQVTVTRRIQLSPDGRTMTYVAAGTSGNGSKYANDTRVYEKQ